MILSSTPQYRSILQKAHNIAVCRTDRLGDMVLTLPMFSALRAVSPQATLHLLCNSAVEPLVANQPVIDKIWYIDREGTNLRELFVTTKTDLVFFPRPRPKEAVAAALAGVKTRVGSKYRWYSALYNVRIPDHRKTAQYHEAEYNVRMIEYMAGQQFPVRLVPPIVDPGRAPDLCSSSDLPLIVLHPGGGGSAPLWPAARFADLVAIILANRPMRFAVTGIDSEATIAAEVAEGSSAVTNLCGTLDMQELFNVVGSADLVICGSTGVAHIAAALGTPVLGLYPTKAQLSSARWGPYSRSSRTLTPPIDSTASETSIIGIDPKTVADTALEMLAAQR